jgi:hypothetical protein
VAAVPSEQRPKRISADKLLRELANPNLRDVPTNLPFRVEMGDPHDKNIRWVVAASTTVAIGHAALDMPIATYPSERFTLRNDILFIRQHAPAGQLQSADPTRQSSFPTTRSHSGQESGANSTIFLSKLAKSCGETNGGNFIVPFRIRQLAILYAVLIWSSSGSSSTNISSCIAQRLPRLAAMATSSASARIFSNSRVTSLTDPITLLHSTQHWRSM